jgi:hypothetical protein
VNKRHGIADVGVKLPSNGVAACGFIAFGNIAATDVGLGVISVGEL